MSDLSRLLDDVYGPSDGPKPSSPPAPEPSPSGLPDWALDSVLDDAFSDWIPGSQELPADAPGAVGTDTGPAAATEAPPEPSAPVAARAWMRADDDILPTRRSGRGGRSDGEPLVLTAVPPAPDAPDATQVELAGEATQVELAGEEEPVTTRSRFRRRKG